MVGIVMMLNGMYQGLENSSGTMVTILYFGGTFLAKLTNDCTLLMFHLGYYSIAHKIKLVQVKLTNNNQIELPPWRGSKQILLHLCEACAALGSIFSFPILYLITEKLVKISFFLFFIICGLLQDNSLFSTEWIVVMCVQVVFSLIDLLIALHATDMPVCEVINKMLTFS